MILTKKLHKSVVAELNNTSLDNIKRRLKKCYELIEIGQSTPTTLKWINYYETYLADFN